MKRSLVFPGLFVVGALVAAVQACSQHAPGPYEQGGRTEPTSVIGSVAGPGGGPPDAGNPDVFTLPDVFTPPNDSGGGGG